MKNKSIIALLALAALTGACSDDDNEGFQRREGYVYLMVGQGGQWAEGASRSGVEAPMRLDCDLEGAQPLYLHTEMAPTPAAAMNETVETRGKRYTGAVFDNGSIADFCVIGVGEMDRKHFTHKYTIADMEKDPNGQGNVGNSSQESYWYYESYSSETGVLGDERGENPYAAFYGYAPYFEPDQETVNENGLRYYNRGLYTLYVPAIEYQVPADVAKQLDLLTSNYNRNYKDWDVELVFDHVLSAVKFRVDETTIQDGLTHQAMQWSDGLNVYNVAIKSVSIRDVYCHGFWRLGEPVYATSGADPANNWTLLDNTTGSYTITPAKSLAEETQAVEVNPDESDNVFMMLPQTTPDGATLQIVCTMTPVGGGTERDVTFTLAFGGKEWKPGYTYNYTIKLTDVAYVFTLDDSDQTDGTTPTYNAPCDGKDAFSLDIKSYKMGANADNKVPVKWKAYSCYSTSYGGTFDNPTSFTYSDYVEGINPNDWAHLRDIENVLVNTDLHAGATPDADERMFDLVVDEYFVKRNMDLSLYNIDNETRIKRSTANCYIVAHPGIYRIPLVYGNACTNGEEKPNAYTDSKADGFNGLKVMKNYLDNGIQSPYIETDIAKSSKTVSSASLVWEDVQGLISDVTLVEGEPYNDAEGTPNKYLEFRVKPANMNYGNAIVAVKDQSGDIVWSWHIWTCEPERFTKLNTYSTTRSGETYTFAGRNLGWVDKYDETKYLDPPRSMKVKLVQEESGRVLEFTLTQKGVSFKPTPRNAMYQFGRKDPMAGATPLLEWDKNILNAANITTYGNMTWSTRDVGASKVSIGQGIQNPNLQYIRSGTINATIKKYLYWGDDYKNLWNIGAGNSMVDNNSVQKCFTKTIYDPCPVGYRVPPSAAFANFGLGSWVLYDCRTERLADGYYYAGFSNNNFIFPFVGYRDSDNSGLPVDFNFTSYYGMATASPSDFNEYQMVRFAQHSGAKGFDDSHKGMRNRSTQIRAIKDPDGQPERQVDIDIHDDTVKPVESLAGSNSQLW